MDGLGVGDVGNVVLRDRQHLAEDGIMIVALALDGASGQLVGGPDLVSRGFVYVKESDELMDEAQELMQDVLERCIGKGCTDWGQDQVCRQGFPRRLYLEKNEAPSHDPSHHHGCVTLETE